MAKNGVVAGSKRDVLRADNHAHIAATKATVADSMKVEIFLYKENVHKYKQLNYDLENYFSKGIDN